MFDQCQSKQRGAPKKVPLPQWERGWGEGASPNAPPSIHQAASKPHALLYSLLTTIAAALLITLASPNSNATEPTPLNNCPTQAQPGETPDALLERMQPHALRCKHDINYLFTLGQLLNTLQHYDQAIDPLESALMQQPDHWPAQLEYAIALDGSGERDSAAALLAQLETQAQLPLELKPVIQQRRQQWQQASASPILTQHRLALITGYDDNLLGSTRTTQLDLTLPNGTLPVLLDPASQPKAGNFERIDWQYDIRRPARDGSYWNLQLGATARHAPSHQDTNFNILGLSLEHISPNKQGPYLQFAAQNLHTQGANVYRLAGISGGLDFTAGQQCPKRIALELQHRQFPQATLYNGLYSGLLLDTYCPQSGWHARMRYGRDFNEYDNRPGDDQNRLAFHLGKQTTLGNHRLNLELDLESLNDQSGYSPLLADNLIRKINKAIYRVEYKTTYAGLEPSAGVEWLTQKSNLSLYDIRTRMAYIGLNFRW